jgi:NAD(P)-dependent dehydrogenase (short-subunit alcohol dehydrogenase family)
MARFRLDGRVALVTGGGSGIGAAICRAYAEQGASVLVADINAEHGQQVAAELAASGAFQRTDVTDLGSVRAAVAAAVERFSRLDVLVNCAGLGLVGNVQETTAADWDRLLAVNVTGVFHGARAAVDQFLGQAPSGGVIVNIASVAGQIGVPRRFAYCATKGAVIAITKQLAVDYAQQGIRCNAICPGTVYTPFVENYLDRFHADNKDETLKGLHARQPMGRMGRPDEIADLAVYLASNEAAFMTGSELVIDGGWTAQ